MASTSLFVRREKKYLFSHSLNFVTLLFSFCYLRDKMIIRNPKTIFYQLRFLQIERWKFKKN